MQQTTTKTKIEEIRKQNIKKLLNWKIERDLQAIKNAFGILKDLKKDPVKIQRELRKDRKLKR